MPKKGTDLNKINTIIIAINIENFNLIPEV